MELDLLNIVLSLVTGLFIGFAIGMTGIGGGVLIQPALIQVLGIEPVLAVGTGLVYAVLTKAWATVSHLRLGTVRKRRVLYFLLGSVPGVVFASRLVNVLLKQNDPAAVNSALQSVMGAVLLFTALAMAFSGGNRERVCQPAGTGPFPAGKKVMAAGLGFVIGVLIGGTSIGGGVLIIPVLLTFLDCDARQAVGTSIAVSVFLSLIGGAVYAFYGNFVLQTSLLMALGSLPGVHFGARLSTRMNEKTLRIIVMALVAFSGVSLFIRR
jgi:uncharacterized protein